MYKEDVIKTGVILAIACAVLFGLWVAGFRNVESTKAAAPDVWTDAGYEIIAYRGYTWAPIHGSNVYYVLRPLDDNGITYSGSLRQWRGEQHIYTLEAIDAIKPGN